ncbi:MAG: cell division protein FtsX [Flavobacteriaceae bacterium]
MGKPYHVYQRRQLIRSYISVVVSIGLVLFVVGVLGLLVLNTQRVAQHVKEQIVLTVFLDDQAKEVEVEQLKTMLALAPFTKSALFISKAQAAQEHSAEIGEDFMDFLGYNPLKDAIDLRLKGSYVNTLSVDSISTMISDRSYVSEVVYDRPLIGLLNENIERISLLLLISCGFFLIVSILLINNSIRLSIYAKRMVIKTMQLVGARKGFIRRPFVRRYVLLGLLSALLACGGIWGLLQVAIDYVPNLSELMDIETILMAFGGVVLLSFVITSLSATLATQRYLNLKTDFLY